MKFIKTCFPPEKFCKDDFEFSVTDVQDRYKYVKAFEDQYEDSIDEELQVNNEDDDLNPIEYIKKKITIKSNSLFLTFWRIFIITTCVCSSYYYAW
jgi:hypothetical protein